MTKLPQAVSGMIAKLDSRTRRERLLLLTAVCTLLILSFLQFVHAPLDERSNSLRQKQQSIQAEVASLESRAEAIVKRSQQNPNEKLRRTIEQLEQEIDVLDTRLQRRTVDLISPDDMVRLLGDMLRANDTLEILTLENLEPVALDLGRTEGQKEAAGKRSPATPTIFRHPVKLTFSGDYLSTLDYLRALEEIEQRFFWDKLDIVVEDHPQSRISLTVHTLSLDRRWVGI